MVTGANPRRFNEIPLNRREYLRYVYEKIHEYKREQRLREVRRELDKESDLNSFEDPVENKSQLPESPPASSNSSKKVKEIYALRKPTANPRPIPYKTEHSVNNGRDYDRRGLEQPKNEGKIGSESKTTRPLRNESVKSAQPAAKPPQPPTNMRGGPISAFQSNMFPAWAKQSLQNSVSSQHQRSVEKKSDGKNKSKNESRNDVQKKDKDPEEQKNCKAGKVSPEKQGENKDKIKDTKDNIEKPQNPEKLNKFEGNGDENSSPSPIKTSHNIMYPAWAKQSLQNSVSSQRQRSVEKRSERKNNSKNDVQKKDKDPEEHKNCKGEKVSSKKQVQNEEKTKDTKDNIEKPQKPEKVDKIEANGDKDRRPSSKPSQYGKAGFNSGSSAFRSAPESRRFQNSSAPPDYVHGGSPAPSIFTYAPLQPMQPQVPNMPVGFQYVHSYHQPPMLPMNPISKPQFINLPPQPFPPQQFSRPVPPPTMVYTSPRMKPPPHLNHPPYEAIYSPGPPPPPPIAMQYTIPNHPPQEFYHSQPFYPPNSGLERYGQY
ncbi:unnamed protein product [Bursaphelenchus xylophilus]|uniref:(pine wood nematode) hypothetical protein n=1 Tax=Bursaphelenchus xylophilus TaxID=6326 RepID=A0A1I7S6T1_BURXY|nr:unnamed protein product [Bursaphelenchus xylophilus]CAG9079809.1 unnamed protein product [Bursaphelenchus xylophilus]